MGFIVKVGINNDNIKDKNYFTSNEILCFHMLFNNFCYFSLLNITGFNDDHVLFIEYDDITGEIIYENLLTEEGNDKIVISDKSFMNLVDRYVSDEDKNRVLMEYKLINKDGQFDIDLGHTTEKVVYSGYDYYAYIVSDNITGKIIRVFHSLNEAIIFLIDNIDDSLSIYGIEHWVWYEDEFILDSDTFSIKYNSWLDKEEIEILKNKFKDKTVIVVDYDKVENTN